MAPMTMWGLDAVARLGRFWGPAALLLLLGAVSGCEIHTTRGPGPQHPPTAGPPPPAEPAGEAAPSPTGPGDERTATHSSVAAQVATVRGLLRAISAAVADRGLGLGPRAKRAHTQASPKAREARQELLAGHYRKARSRAMQALRMAAPAVDELSGKPNLPPPVRQVLAEQATVSRDAVHRAIEAVRATGSVAGLPHFQQAAALLNDVARAAGGGRPPARTMAQAAAELDRGIAARWPAL